MKTFYVDTCIYLNLWKKEGDKIFGTPYWELAKDFFEKIENKNLTIYYSGFLLRELQYILTNEKFNQKVEMFNASPNFKKIILSQNEFKLARAIERESNYEISFFDIIHLLLTRKTNSILITRDRKLLEIAEKYSVVAKRPEEIKEL